ncbi:unnamed protein product [Brassica napus]|uniref:(rape) hypothetical protein n=1 Tax=Brassica napus TaxID=3708 RepID=A0A816ZTC6_BRANA|nr:unnamed protein product [Brassica napus]
MRFSRTLLKYFCFELLYEKRLAYSYSLCFCSFFTEKRLTQNYSLSERRREERIRVLCFILFCGAHKDTIR